MFVDGRKIASYLTGEYYPHGAGRKCTLISLSPDAYNKNVCKLGHELGTGTSYRRPTRRRLPLFPTNLLARISKYQRMYNMFYFVNFEHGL